MEAGDQFSDVANNPAAREMCELALAAMAQGVRCPGFENDLLVFSNEDILEEGKSFLVPTMLIHRELLCFCFRGPRPAGPR